MLNLREELKEYIEEGSINIHRLRAVVGKIQDTQGARSIANKPKEFLEKVKDISQITFQFVDKKKGTRQRLVTKHPILQGDTVLVDSFSIEPIVSAASQEGDRDGGTPMWVDNEWYRDKIGRVFRWMGRKSYNKEDQDYKMHEFKEVKSGDLHQYWESIKDEMTRVYPEDKDGKVEYVERANV